MSPIMTFSFSPNKEYPKPQPSMSRLTALPRLHLTLQPDPHKNTLVVYLKDLYLHGHVYLATCEFSSCAVRFFVPFRRVANYEYAQSSPRFKLPAPAFTWSPFTIVPRKVESPCPSPHIRWNRSSGFPEARQAPCSTFNRIFHFNSQLHPRETSIPLGYYPNPSLPRRWRAGSRASRLACAGAECLPPRIGRETPPLQPLRQGPPPQAGQLPSSSYFHE